METKQKKNKEKRIRNNEKRKEKSRDAARCRRSKETEIFTDLAQALPISKEQTSQLDKASIMRLAIAYLRVRDMVDLIPQPLMSNTIDDEENDSVFLKSMDGFLLVLSPDGDFVYLSENVSEYLGIAQIDLMGQNIYEYSHPCDHDEIKELLSNKTKDNSATSKSFFIRLKCTLTSKGRSVNLKSASYKVLHCKGNLLKTDSELKNSDANNNNKIPYCLAAIAQLIPHPSNIEAPLPKQTFLTKHSLDMKFTHADDNIMKSVLGYDEEELLGKSVYEYHHAMDSDAIFSAYKCLFSKGQCETSKYRFLAKNGGYVWVLTQATLIYDKMQKPQSVVCVNFVISGVEREHEIYSAAQLQSRVLNGHPDVKRLPVAPLDLVDESTTSSLSNVSAYSPLQVVQELPVVKLDPCLGQETLPEQPETARVQAATSKIFAPRTEEMNKGFLTFSEDESGLTSKCRIMLKEEPEDLTHLAPTAGDVCVPLVDHPYLSPEVLDEILLRENFSPLLTGNETTDPFISYRDTYDLSPQILSPNYSKNSDCSLPSLNSPSDSLGDDDQMSSFIGLHLDEDQEIHKSAPYIPMNGIDDLPLLMQTSDLIWDHGVCSPSESNSNHGNLITDGSSLAELLSTSVNKHHIKINDHGGGIVNEDHMIGQYKGKSHTNWNVKNTLKTNQIHQEKTLRGSKRTNANSFIGAQNKKMKYEPKDSSNKMHSELLQQLITNTKMDSGRKNKNWLLNAQKAACVSQPSDSVLMNLLVSGFDIRAGYICLAPTKSKR